MSIYTKIGDSGKTTFFGCGPLQKNDCRIEALGTLDELNSVIGLAMSFIEDEELQQDLHDIQNDLFQVGADVAGSALVGSVVPRVTEEYIHKLEQRIDELEGKLGLPKKFILPGGTKASAFLHLCRTITRRAERHLVAVKDVLQLNPLVLKYVNRLSDFLYVLAREANKEAQMSEQQPMYKYLVEEKLAKG